MAIPGKFIRERLLDGLRDELRPDGTLESLAQEIMHVIQGALDKKGADAVCVLGGSVSKGTYLKGNHDIDFFARFPLTTPGGLLPELLEEALQLVVAHYHAKLHRLHGSRDYFQFRVSDPRIGEGTAGEVTVEVIPVLAIETAYDAKNVTDVSPLHVGWVAKHTTGNQVLCDEIRLGKQFCKAAGIYGAESYISGFSGHVVDILTIHYGSFLKLVSAAVSEWKSKVVLDPEHHLKDPLGELNDAKIVSPMILIDPVDKDRNAAAALSPESFETFKRWAKGFLSAADQKKAQDYFTIKMVTKESLQADLQAMRKKKTGDTALFLMHWTPLTGKKDVMGAKLLKAYGHIQRMLAEHEFTVRKSGWTFSLAYFFVDATELPATRELEGPPKLMKEAVAEFVKAHGKTVEEKAETMIARIPRTYRKPEALMKALSTDGYLWEKVADLKLERA